LNRQINYREKENIELSEKNKPKLELHQKKLKLLNEMKEEFAIEFDDTEAKLISEDLRNRLNFLVQLLYTKEYYPFSGYSRNSAKGQIEVHLSNMHDKAITKYFRFLHWHFTEDQVEKIFYKSYCELKTVFKTKEKMYDIIKVALSIVMQKQNLAPKLQKQYPLIPIDIYDFVIVYFGEKWRENSGAKKKLGLEQEEFAVLPSSIVFHLIMGDAFGYEYLNKTLRKHGAIVSIVLGVGYLKTIHSKKINHDIIKPPRYTKVEKEGKDKEEKKRTREKKKKKN